MKTVIALFAILAILGGGYLLTKDSNTKPVQTKVNHAETDATGEDVQAVATDVVKISDFAFTPVNIKIKKGDTVTWTNEDNVEHTITESDDRDGPKSDELQKGDTYTFTFNDVGTFKYKCSLHPAMTGTVTVEE